MQGFFADFVGLLRSMNKDEATVLVVSHGGTIAAILRYLAAEQGRIKLIQSGRRLLKPDSSLESFEQKLLSVQPKLV